MSAPDLRPARRRGRCRNRMTLSGTLLLPSLLILVLCLPRGASAWWFSPSSSSPPAEEKSPPSDSAESSSSSSWKHRPVSEEDGLGGEEEEAGLPKGKGSERGRDEDSPSSSRSGTHSTAWEEEGSLGDEEGSPASGGTKSRSHSSLDEEGSTDSPSSSSSFDSPSGSLRHGGSSSSSGDERESESSTSSSRHRGRTPPSPEGEDATGSYKTGSSLGSNRETECPGVFPYHTVAAVYLTNVAVTLLVAVALLTGLESIPNCTPLRYRSTAVLILGVLAGAFVLIHLATPLGFFDGLIPSFGLLAVVCLLGTAPIILFREFREILLHTTHPWLLSPHVLRVLHFLFLPLYDVGLLPLAFAGPAGWGGLVLGLSAPVVALAFGAHREWARGLGIVWAAAGALELVGVLVLNAVFIPGFIVSSQEGDKDMGFMWHSVLLVAHYTIPVLLVLHGFSLWKLAVQGDTTSQPTMIWQEDDAELADIYGPDSPGAQGSTDFDAFMREASLKSSKGSASASGAGSGVRNGSPLGGGEKEREMVQVKEGGAHAQNGESEPLKHQEP